MAVFCQWFLASEPSTIPPRSSQKEKGLLLLWDLVLLLASWVIPQMPVIARWLLWFTCCILTTTLILLLVEKPKSAERKACVIVVVAFMFMASLHSVAHRQVIEEKSAALSGDLLDGPSQIFTDNITRMVPMLEMGNGEKPTTGLIMTPKPTQEVQPYFVFFPDAAVKLEPGKRGPIISTVMRDRFGNKVVEIERNHWKVYPPYCSDKNYTESALEILDNSGHVLLQLKIFPYYVLMNGEWWDNEGHGRRIVPAPAGGGFRYSFRTDGPAQ
jgi:hypothetical protein